MNKQHIIDLIRRGKGQSVLSYLLWREKFKKETDKK